MHKPRESFIANPIPLSFFQDRLKHYVWRMCLPKVNKATYLSKAGWVYNYERVSTDVGMGLVTSIFIFI